MSCDIREYYSYNLGSGCDIMSVTAFGGTEVGKAVQFTIGQSYCALPEDAVKDLIKTLQNRLHLVEGYTATGEERDDIMYGGRND